MKRRVIIMEPREGFPQFQRFFRDNQEYEVVVYRHPDSRSTIRSIPLNWLVASIPMELKFTLKLN